ncbi:putative F-box/LRR-repeat protein At5g41630 [Silene latifolia]|uniref:putative F-box/LRR-repeat protein At5g41630 n=1 Tax=Silene latifolia TaxID=37657 RepID=UPI003D76AB67
MTSRIQNRIRSSDDNINVDRDRLSELPDDVILHILSRMPIIDAVRTVLLRRFGNLWTFIHTLDFDLGEYLKKFSPWKSRGKHIQWFYHFVRNVLILHQNLSIDRFHLSIDIDFKSYKEERADLDILIWSRFALCRQAKEISISMKYKYDFCCSSVFPKFTSQFLVTLELSFCKFEGEFQVELESLKKLSLNHVWMTGENFQRFIRGCPSLQKLVISNPFKMNYLAVHQWASPLLLYFSNIENLSSKTKTWQLDIVDVSSVRDICIKNLKFIKTNDLVLTINKVLVGKFEGVGVSRLSCDASKE